MVLSRFAQLFQSLAKTRNILSGILHRVSQPDLSLNDLEELESVFLGADMGVETAEGILEWIRTQRNHRYLKTDLKVYLQNILSVEREEKKPQNSQLMAVFIVGVNGTGKTTTAAKLAHYIKVKGLNVLLIGADTYRAAAVQQLRNWCEIAKVQMIDNESARDPSSVVYDGLKAAQSRGCDFAIIDTAGRLHTHKNLMNEVKKMYSVVSSRFPEIHVITYITLDANLGQNSLIQARQFNEHIPLDGIILTKMDGTAKGGIVFPIYQELGIPVKYFGLGETLDDLIEFNVEEYVSSLLDAEDSQI